MATSPDTARAVLSDPRAPADERYDATSELSREYKPASSSLIPAEVLAGLIERAKSDPTLLKAEVLPFPGRIRPPPKDGMQSVYLDDVQVQMQGEWYEKPGALPFESLRDMVAGTPILSSIVLTRIRQVQRFCSPSEDGGIGFEVRHVDRAHEPTDEQKTSMKLLTRFFQNCGWEWNPRARKKLRRENFAGFNAKLVRDSLTFDAAPIETEMKRDKKLGIDGFYAVDGSTIRLCTEDGYDGDPDVYAVQVVQGRVACTYTHEDLIYEVRNPRSDVRLAGYGYAEPELLVRTITAFLNAFTYNTDYFDKNSIPKGLLQISGDYGPEDIDAFKRYLAQMVQGQPWTLPVLTTREGAPQATWTPFNVAADEMAYSKWMILLTSISCAIYGMDPEEISFESFSASKSSLSGSDTTEKLANSKDKGLRPLMSHLETTNSDFIVSAFSDDYCFRWVGMDEEDQEQAWEGTKLVCTVNELRADKGLPPHPDPDMGDAPLNPQLVGPWMQLRHPPPAQPGQDFGGQGDGQDFDSESGGEDGGGSGPAMGEPGDQGAGDSGQDPTMNGDQPADFGQPKPGPDQGGGDFGKALSMSTIYGLRG